MHTPGHWTRHLLGTDSPSDVGGVALDVDGDGWIDFVAGGAWYRNSRDAGTPFTRFTFDADLTGGHALIAGDVTGNGLPDIVAKPWNPRPDNAVGGKIFVVFLENVSRE